MPGKYISMKSEIEIKQIINYPEDLKILSVFITNDTTSEYKKVSRQYNINLVGFEIITLLDGTKTIEEITNIQTKKYKSNFSDTKKKIINYLNELEQKYEIETELLDFPTYKPVNVITTDNIYPITASLELTHKCNLRCLHCYGDYGVGDEMDCNNVLKLLDQLEEIGVKNIELTGGDISIYPYLNEVLKKAFSLKFSAVVLLTNGIIMNKEFLDIIVKNKNRVFLQIDLHSLNEEYLEWFTNQNGYIDKVLSNIQFLNNNGVKMRIATMITKRNVEEIPQIVAKINELGISSFIPSIVTNIGRAEDNEDLLLDNESDIKRYVEIINEMNEKYPSLFKAMQPESLRNNCGCITTNVVISPNGDIKLCAMDNHFLKNLGNVFKENIRDVYDCNKEFIRNLYYLKFPTESSIECTECDKKFFCSRCFIRTFYENSRRKEVCKWYENNISKSIVGRFINVKNE